MNSRKYYKSPLVLFAAWSFTDVLSASGGDDFGDWSGTNWGTTGGDAI